MILAACSAPFSGKPPTYLEILLVKGGVLVAFRALTLKSLLPRLRIRHFDGSKRSQDGAGFKFHVGLFLHLLDSIRQDKRNNRKIGNNIPKRYYLIFALSLLAALGRFAQTACCFPFCQTCPGILSHGKERWSHPSPWTRIRRFRLPSEMQNISLIAQKIRPESCCQESLGSTNTRLYLLVGYQLILALVSQVKYMFLFSTSKLMYQLNRIPYDSCGQRHRKSCCSWSTWAAALHCIHTFVSPPVSLCKASKLPAYSDLVSSDKLKVDVVETGDETINPVYKDKNVSIYAIPISASTSDMPIPTEEPSLPLGSPSSSKRKHPDIYENAPATKRTPLGSSTRKGSPQGSTQSNMIKEDPDSWRKLIIGRMFPGDGGLTFHGGVGISARELRQPLPSWHHRPFATSYLVVGPEFRGKFDGVLADELGVPYGPVRRQLTSGQSITLENGQVITPEMVVGKASLAAVRSVLLVATGF